MRIRRPVRLALIVAGLAGGWWAGALLGEHYSAPPLAGGPSVHAPATRPAGTTATPTRPPPTRPAAIPRATGR